MDTAPACPTCHAPVSRVNIGGLTSYQCGNDACLHFPATAFLLEPQALAEWLLIVTAVQAASQEGI